MIAIIVLKILGIIVLCIILIIAIALALPVKILAFTDENRKLKLLYKWAFFTFGEKPNPNSPIINFAKKCIGVSRFENFDNIGENIKTHGLTETVEDFFSVVSGLLSEVRYLLPHCTIHKLKLRIINASDDCALTAVAYGTICGVAYPVLNFIYSNTKQKKDFADVNIFCDFNSSKPEFSFDIKISVLAFFAAVAFVRLSVEDYMNRRKSVKSDK